VPYVTSESVSLKSYGLQLYVRLFTVTLIKLPSIYILLLSSLYTDHMHSC